MSGSLLLIAGYPKSGSTWIRLLFEALTRPLDSSVAINELGNGFYGGWRRTLFDTIAPITSANLLPDEIDLLLPDIFRQLASESAGLILVKVHDLAFRTRAGEWLYPPDHVSSVIYLVRHPFDVAASFAHHLGIDIQTAVAIMNRDHVMAPAGPRMIMPIHERIGSWSANIASWLDETPYPITLTRYEDLRGDPVGSFARVAAAAGFRKDPEFIHRAAQAVNFNRLQAEEQTHGFGERPRSSPKFFRAGKPRSWEGILDPHLRDQIVRDHGAVMERLGYASDGETRPMPGRRN
ncbi:MAG TPA: sulfotransferase domain-containing protein [Rhizomicrobium sp.]|jgi:hypothetical protein|nr:sulfotransferase domain-containing protein [Rhizomicrobium sp.]